MEAIDKRITAFLKKKHVLHLATSVNDMPYAASLFYIYIEDDNMLVFASDSKTIHITQAMQNANVAGTIADQTFITGRIRGIQFNGVLSELNNEILRKTYISRFPVALFMPLTLWGIRLNYLKMTDNRLGFGKKIIWKNA